VASPADGRPRLNADQVRDRYAEITYPGGAFPQTHPARHAAIARLFGVPAPDVRTARVLEVGCAQGYNLLPLAARFPEARFVGVDFSDHELAHGRALAAEAGVGNVGFVCADLRTFAPPAGSFDYIIAHGVLSWVPDDVKAALFALCDRALAPAGVAYISYNTYPGWKQREALRELMVLRAGGSMAPADRLAAAHRALGTIDRLLADRPEPHARLTCEIIASMRRKAPGQFFHDDLDGVNDPCYFLQFAGWAAEHRLAYLAEAEWETMFPELLPAAARPALAEFAGDRLMFEQHLDFLRNRTFRCSLLVRADQPLNPQLDPTALRACAFGSPLAPPTGVPPLAANIRVRFGGDDARAFETRDPLVKAIFTTLGSVWPRRVPFAELLDSTRSLLALAQVPVPADHEHALLARLLEACGRRSVDFLRGSPVELADAAGCAPRAELLTRLMAARRAPVANTWHESQPLDAAQRALLATLDGTRTEFSPAERRQLAAFAAAGLLAESNDRR
jgi:SAM-dependent methyltransferase